MSKVIEVTDLSKVYEGKDGKKVHALKGISFDMNEGDFTVLMGHSGAGKSTALNIISAMLRPTSGKILVKGDDMFSFNDKELVDFKRNNIGFIFQDFNMLETLSIRENIGVPLMLINEKAKSIKHKVSDVAEKVGIKDTLNKLPGQCSGGQIQRVAIARALASSPKLVIADEPTGNLDIDNAHNLMRLMKKINKEDGTSVLLVTHDPMVASYSKNVIFLEDGLIKQEIIKGDKTQKEYYKEILKVLTAGSKDFLNKDAM